MAGPRSSTETPDILHPLSTLEWEERPSLPVDMYNPQAVFLDGTLHVGGGTTSGGLRDHARLYSCKPGGDGSWIATDTPTCYYALTTYDSHLLLVGGKEYLSEQITNKIYTMIDGEFKELLPPMKEKRSSSSAVSSGSVLAVAGGRDGSRKLSSVEVYNGGQWTSGQSLPDARHDMKSVFHGDKWILIGGTEQGTKVYCVSLQSLVSGTEQSPWETLPDVPFEYSATAVFGGRILSIGGWNYSNPTSSIHAYSPDTQSWIHVRDLHVPTPLSSTCAIVVPSGELIVLGGGWILPWSKQVFRAFIKMSLVDANLQFSIPKLFQLHRCGIKLIEELSKDRFRFYATAGVQLLKGDRQRAPSLSAKDYVELIFRAWLTSKRPTYPPTWESLFTVLRKMDLVHLAEQIVTGSLPAKESSPQSSEPLVEEGPSQEEDGNREEMILHQKAGLKLQTLQIEDLQFENKQLRAEIADLRMFFQVKQETFASKGHPSDYQPSASSLQQPKQEEVLLRTKPETTPVTTETLLAPPTEVLMAESDATIKMHKEKVQQLLSEIQTLRSQLALPAPVKSETTFNLPGVEVVGQTSVMVTKSEQSFHWTGYGFKLHIPQDSLPAGVDRCLLHISASIASQYQFPDNMELVSAVYWVRSEPYCRFQQALTAELQHCAKMTSSTKLTFIRSFCSQKNLPYTFKGLEMRGSFSDQSSYGSLQLDHFSSIAVAGENVDRNYTARLYYLDKSVYSMKIHFVIMWDIEPHVKKVKRYYKKERAKEGAYLPVEFEEEKISLDIPMPGGVTVSEWKLTPLVPPNLFRRQVDSFKPGQNIPSCQLKATLPLDHCEPIPELSHQVTLLGAKKPKNVMMIEIDPFLPADLSRHSKGQSTMKFQRKRYSLQSVSGTSRLEDLNTHIGALVPTPRDYWQRPTRGSSLTAFNDVTNPETATSLPVGIKRRSSLASLTPPYPGLLPHQHTGYYPTTFGSTAYPSPYHRMQGSYQTGGLGDSLISFGGAGPSTLLSSDTPKTSFTFKNLERELKAVMRWHRLGTNLGIPQEQLEEIEWNYSKVDRQKLALVKLIVGNYQFSWEDICTALEKMEETILATQIRSKYCNEDTTHSESTSEDQSISGSASVGDKRKQERSTTTIEEEQVPTKRSKLEQSSEEQ